MIGTEFTLLAVVDKRNGYLKHFGIHVKMKSIYGVRDEQIVRARMRASENQVRDPKLKENDPSKADYWGWYDTETQAFSTSLIWAAYFLLNMCFTYGIKASEEKGQGKAYRLEIVSTEPYLAE
jgi:hypothetical protein